MGELKSYLSKNDVALVKGVLRDISLELCDCDCCKGDKDCTLFERMLLAVQLLYERVCDDIASPTEHFNMLSDPLCYDSGTAASLLVNSKSKKQKVGVRRKMMSWFFVYMYQYFQDIGAIPAAEEKSYVPIGFFNIFADNATFVYENCVECCS